MFDAKVLFEQILEMRDNPGAFRELRGQEFDVQRDRKMLFPQRPNVHVVDVGHLRTSNSSTRPG